MCLHRIGFTLSRIWCSILYCRPMTDRPQEWWEERSNNPVRVCMWSSFPTLNSGACQKKLVYVWQKNSCKVVKWETLQSAAGIHWCYAASVPLRLCITCWGGHGSVGMDSKCTCFLRSGKRIWGHTANGLVRRFCLFCHYEWYSKPL